MGACGSPHQSEGHICGKSLSVCCNFLIRRYFSCYFAPVYFRLFRRVCGIKNMVPMSPCKAVPGLIQRSDGRIGGFTFFRVTFNFVDGGLFGRLLRVHCYMVSICPVDSLCFTIVIIYNFPAIRGPCGDGRFKVVSCPCGGSGRFMVVRCPCGGGRTIIISGGAKADGGSFCTFNIGFHAAARGRGGNC